MEAVATLDPASIAVEPKDFLAALNRVLIKTDPMDRQRVIDDWATKLEQREASLEGKYRCFKCREPHDHGDFAVVRKPGPGQPLERICESCNLKDREARGHGA